MILKLLLFSLYFIQIRSLHSKAHPGVFACTDGSKCTKIDQCTKEDAAYRAGYLCNDFPWYNGDYLGTKFDFLPHEKQSINCLQGQNASCSQWNVTKSSKAYHTYLNCECQLFDSNPLSDVCLQWNCSGISVETCYGSLLGSSDCGGWINVTDYGEGYYHSCCYYSDSGEGRSHKHITDIRIDCQATETETDSSTIHSNVSYLKSWTCLQYRGKNVINEEYSCSQRNSFGYCEQYFGSTDSERKFYNLACTCELDVTTSTNNGEENNKLCKFYHCRGKGARKYAPNINYISAAVLVGGLIAVIIFMIHCGGGRYDLSIPEKCLCGIPFFILHLAALFFTVWGGGFASLLFGELIVICEIFVCCVCLFNTNTVPRNYEAAIKKAREAYFPSTVSPTAPPSTTNQAARTSSSVTPQPLPPQAQAQPNSIQSVPNVSIELTPMEIATSSEHSKSNSPLSSPYLKIGI